MKIHFLKSATTIVETRGVKILTDPWLVDGEYYGSWFHYPPYDFVPEHFADLDYIYISHIHPDHFSRSTLSQLRREIPVLIHNYDAKYLKRNIESLGFVVHELEHDTRTHLKNGVHINILAADNCNPELCQKFLGCGRVETKFGSTQIDSLSVIDDGTFSLLNVNDCPFELAGACAPAIQAQYGDIDFLLVGYAGAGPYPQCFANLSLEEKTVAAAKKKQQFLMYGRNYLELFKPHYYMPFAGTYTLGGHLAKWNDLRGVPFIEEALAHYSEHCDGVGILLNSDQYFDLETKTQSSPYIEPDNRVRQEYIEQTLTPKAYSFHNDPMPKLEDFQALIDSAYQQMDRVRRSIGFHSETDVVVTIIENLSVVVPMDGSPVQWITNEDVGTLDRYVRFTVDPRLLLNILKGPRYGHWNNAEIGSHIEFYRKPNVFERGIYYCMNFFFSVPPSAENSQIEAKPNLYQLN